MAKQHSQALAVGLENRDTNGGTDQNKHRSPLPIGEIRRDGGTQNRVHLNQSIILEYAQLMDLGACFPPVTVWYDGTSYWLVDGFHRVAAAEKCGRETVDAEIKCGSLGDALWSSLQRILGTEHVDPRVILHT
jgi:hypothetical protein